ncbi:MAG: VOC family protein [Magnetococcales bacterium]|nr:VOC family protein [Magnetococcales bacterium]NGZ27486.1 VOC family protein [Magnetococcales bacterium]
MFQFTGIHHVAFATKNMEKTTRFWRDLLGMRLVFSHGEEGYRQYFFEISPNNLISFFEWPQVEKVAIHRHGDPVTGPFAFDHVSFGLPDLESLWTLAGRLLAADCPLSDVTNHGFIHSIYTYDPNGIPIEFSAAVPGMDVRKNPLIADFPATSVGQEGSQPLLHLWPPPEDIPHEERLVIQGDGATVFDKHAIRE